MDATEWGFGEGVCWNQCQTINPNLMYTVDCLEGRERGNHVKIGIMNRHGANTQTVQITTQRSRCSTRDAPGMETLRSEEGRLAKRSRIQFP